MTGPPQRRTRAPQGWQARATCRDSDPELFFPEDLEPREQPAATAYAVSVCGSCPVSIACLTDNFDAEYGVFGGLTAEQRGRTRRLHRRAA